MSELEESKREKVEEHSRPDTKGIVETAGRIVASTKRMAGEFRETRQEMEALVRTVDYWLEDEAYKGLPPLLLANHGLAVQERLKRGYVKDSKGNQLEINIIGRATDKDGRLLHVIGESKSQLSQNDINRFLRRKLKPLEGVYDPIFPVLVTYMTAAPDVEAYAESKGIALYYSYEF